MPTPSNIAGATRLARGRAEGGSPGAMWGRIPCFTSSACQRRGGRVWSLIDEHDDVVTYGENIIGRPECPIPALPRLRATTRQPVLLDLWLSWPYSANDAFTTVGKLEAGRRDRVPRRDVLLEQGSRAAEVHRPAGGFAGPIEFRDRPRAAAVGDRPCSKRTVGVSWTRTSSPRIRGSTREYVRGRPASHRRHDQNCGYCGAAGSPRASACYSRRVGRSLRIRIWPDPLTGVGLFAFTTMAEILAAFESHRVGLSSACPRGPGHRRDVLPRRNGPGPAWTIWRCDGVAPSRVSISPNRSATRCEPENASPCVPWASHWSPGGQQPSRSAPRRRRDHYTAVVPGPRTAGQASAGHFSRD